MGKIFLAFILSVFVSAYDYRVDNNTTIKIDFIEKWVNGTLYRFPVVVTTTTKNGLIMEKKVVVQEGKIIERKNTK